MAAYTPKELVAATALTASAVNLYAVPTGKTTTVKTILLANYTSSAGTATIHLVPSAGSASNANKVYGEVNVDANSTAQIDTNIFIPEGASLQALASGTNKINIHVSGIEIG